MEQLIRIFLLILATWRISNLFVWERGPYDIFGKFRNLLQITTITTLEGNQENYSENEIGKLFSCLWCLSPYVALTLFLISHFEVGKIIVEIFALSGGAILVSKFTE